MRPLTVRLTPWQRRQLAELRDHAPSPRIVKRAMCLLLSAQGESATTIARLTGLHRDTITDIRRRWRQRRGRSLTDRPRCGRPPRVTEAYRRALRQALRRGPLSFGYVFTHWSIARLNSHLHQRTGVRISNDWLRRQVHAEGFVVGRPKHTLANRRDEVAYQQARRRLSRLKKGL